MNEPGSGSDPLGEIAESFVASLRRGERPSLASYTDRYPALAEEIRELFPALVELEQLGPEEAEPIGPNRPADARDGEGPEPEQLGDYRILRRVGEGGMGIVYEAVRESLSCHVALKVIHPRFRDDATYLRRFLTEARSAARLHHTNIVSVFDFGEHGGICYYAMQYIPGQGLDKVLADVRRLREKEVAPLEADAPSARAAALSLMTGRFTPEAAAEPSDLDASATATYTPEITPNVGTMIAPSAPREVKVHAPGSADSSLIGRDGGAYYVEVARLGAQVADALGYAHKRGVVHRDIKPSNLLLDAGGNVWITDFGLARFEEGPDMSRTSDVVGTLRFMAPERFHGRSDGRGDVYALGATLYEMLTLRPAFAADNQFSLIQKIHDEPAAPLRQLDPRISRDLETIVLKAMAKEPSDRFASASEMAEELRRFIAGRPIRSRPLWPGARFWRWCKRDPWLAAANVAAAVLLTTLAIGATWSAYVDRGRVTALKQERTRTREASVDAYIAQADAVRSSRRAGQRFKSLDAVAQATRLLDGMKDNEANKNRRDALRDIAISALALPDLRVAKTFGKDARGAVSLDIDPSFERYVTSDADGNCAMHRASDGAVIFRFPGFGRKGACWPLMFDPTGRRLAIGSGNDGQAIQVWRVDGPKPTLVVELPASNAALRSLRFRHDGSALVHLGPLFTPREMVAIAEICTIDADTGKRSKLPSTNLAGDTDPGRRSRFPPLNWALARQAAFHPDGQHLVVVSEFGGHYRADVRGLSDPNPTASIELPAEINDLTWSPDGHRIALAGRDGHLYLWEADRPAVPLLVLSGLNSDNLTVAFNHRGDLLASQGWEGMLRLWDPRTGRQLVSVQSGVLPRFSADDRYLGFGREGEAFQTFDVASGRELRALPGDPSPSCFIQGLSFEPAGRLLAARGEDVRLWDAEAMEPLTDLGLVGWSSSRFEADGSLLTLGPRGLLRWPLRIEGNTRKLGPPRLINNTSANGANLASSRRGEVLLLAIPGRSAITLSPEKPGRLTDLSPQDDVRRGAVSPDGHWAVTLSHNGPESGAVIWEAKTGHRVISLNAENSSDVQFSPDEHLLATSRNGCRIWEVGTWKLMRESDPDSGNIAFSPDGAWLAICARNQVRLRDTATGRLLATFAAPDQGIASHPTFTPDGFRLALVDEQSHAILIWDLQLIRSTLATLGLDLGGSSPKLTETDPAFASPPVAIHAEVRETWETHRARFGAWLGSKKEYMFLRDLFSPQLAFPYAYQQRSQFWHGLGQSRAALADAENALRGREDDALSNAMVGYFAYLTGDDARSRVALARAIQLSTPARDSVARLAWALAAAPKDRDPTRALDMAMRLSLQLTKFPSPNIQARDDTVLTHAAFQHSYRLATRNVLARDSVILALSRLGRDADALTVLKLSPEPSPFSGVISAPCYHRLGQTQKAWEVLDEALRSKADWNFRYPRQERDFRALVEEAEAALSRPPIAVPDKSR